jgi:hypothetical protein
MNTEAYETEYELPADWQTAPRQPNRKRKISMHFMVTEREHSQIMLAISLSNASNLRDFILQLMFSANITKTQMLTYQRFENSLFEISESIKQIEQLARESGNIYDSELIPLYYNLDELRDAWTEALAVLREQAIPIPEIRRQQRK